MVAQSSNPITGIDPPFVSLSGATGTGTGSAILFSRPRSNISMQTVLTGTPDVAVCTLEGTVDGADWMTLATFDLSQGNANKDIISVSAVYVLQARANLTSLSGGSGV